MPDKSRFKPKNIYLTIALILSFSLFVISLTQTAFYTNGPGDNKFSSAFTFAFGWTAILAGEYAEVLIWLANPAYILALIFLVYERKSSAAVASVTSLMFALLFLSRETIATNESGSGSYYTIIIGPGYWLWLLSILIFTLGVLVSNYVERNSSEQNYDE